MSQRGTKKAPRRTAERILQVTLDQADQRRHLDMLAGNYNET